MATITLTVGSTTAGATAGSGTVTCTGSNTTVTGSGTSFTTQMQSTISGENYPFTLIVAGVVYSVLAVNSDTSLTLASATPTFSGASYTIGVRNYAEIGGAFIAAASFVTTNSYVFNLYKDSETVYTTTQHLTLSLTTGNTITIQTAPGQSFRDQAGVRSNALTYNASNGVGIRSSISGAAVLDINTPSGVTISGLQIQGATGGYGISAEGSGTVTITNSMVIGGSTFVGTHTTTTISNSVLDSTGGTNQPVYIDNGSVTCYSCNLITPSDIGASQYVYIGGGGSVALQNCALFGAAALSVGTPTYTSCMTDLTGTTGLVGGKTYANQFVNRTSVGTDWREKAGADLFGAGVQDLTHATTDISGFTRKNPPDIGAWELAAAGPTHGKGGLLLFGIGSIGWTPSMIGAAALWNAGKAIRRNATLSRRSLLTGGK